jgi:hypothetical protein
VQPRLIANWHSFSGSNTELFNTVSRLSTPFDGGGFFPP